MFRSQKRWPVSLLMPGAIIEHILEIPSKRSVEVFVMHGTISKRAIDARETDRQACRETDTSVGDVLSDIAKFVLWPENTAPNLAAACGCSVRQAERILGGHCDWSGDATAAVIAEILLRKKMRNVRVTARK